MNMMDKFKGLVKENSQFISGIIFTGGIALMIYLLRHQIVFLSRSFWSISEVFALPATILFVYWLSRKQRLISKNKALTVVDSQAESQLVTDWRRDLKAIVVKDKMTLADVYGLRASVRLAPIDGEQLTNYKNISSEIVEFCDILVATRQDNEAEVVWLKAESEREQLRIYGYYLLKVEFELANNVRNEIGLKQKLAEVEVATTESIATLREMDKI